MDLVLANIKADQNLVVDGSALNLLAKKTKKDLPVANSMYQRSELDWLIYNDPLSYAELILNGDPELYLKAVTKKTPLD